MSRFTRTLVLAAASVGIVAAAASSSVTAGASTGVDARQVKMAREMAAVATWANTQGLAGLSPASLHPVSVAAAPVHRYPRDVFADIP